MLSTLKFYLKQQYVLLAIAFALLCTANSSWVDLSAGALLVTWLWVYRLNVDEKGKKTWNFFQSLPLSMKEKSAIKIFLPLVIVFTVYLFQDGRVTIYDLLGSAGALALVSAAALVLASIMARSIVGFVVLYCVFWIATRPFSNSPVLMTSVSGVMLGAAVAYLSNRRIDLRKSLLAGLVTAIPFAVIGHYSEQKALAYYLESGSKSDQTAVALKLFEKSDNAAAVKTLENVLRDIDDADLTETVLDAFDSKEKVPDLAREEWLEIVKRNHEIRQVVLDFLRDTLKNDTRVSSLNDGFVKEVEAMVLLDGRTDCKRDCRSLAKLASKIGDLDQSTEFIERMKSYANSGNKSQVRYVLEVMDRHYYSQLEPELTAAMQKADPDLKEDIADVLKRKGDIHLDIKIDDEGGHVVRSKNSKGDVEIRVNRKIKEKIADKIGRKFDHIEINGDGEN